MKIIIAGAGSIGFSPARRLSLEKHRLTFIDEDPERCARAQESFDAAVIVGSATSRSLLAQAGVADADLFIRPEDETVSKIERLLMRSAASQTIELEGGRTVMVGFKLDASCRLLDTRLKDLGDESYAVAAREHLGVILSLFGKADERRATPMILGGGRIGLTLAARLERQRVTIVLFDTDRATSVKAARRRARADHRGARRPRGRRPPGQ